MRRIRGGDATQKGDFPIRKQRLQGSKIFSDFILSTRRIFRGAMRQKIAIFKERNSVCRVAKIFRSHFIYTKNFQGGDATESRDFQREKQRLQGSKFFSDLKDFYVTGICSDTCRF